MDSTTVKVSRRTRDRVRELGAAERLTADQVISEALDALDRRNFWAAYAAAAQADRPSDAEAAEAAAWDATTADGIS